MYKLSMAGRVFFDRKVLAGLFALVFCLCLFAGSQSALANGTATTAQAVVDTKWLADNLDNSGIRILHIGSPSQEAMANFGNSHIKGAAFVSIGSIMEVLGNGSAPPDKARFEALMAKLGIGNDTHVVVYGGSGSNPFITTFFYLMTYFGHEMVSYLDGGLAQWSKDGHKTESGAPAEVAPASYKAAAPVESLRADADHVLKSLKSGSVVVVDVRSSGEHNGTQNMGKKRQGHIPGAVNLDYASTNLNADGTLKSAADLKAAYEAKGVTKDKEVIVYCLGGVRASNTVFVLKEVLGYPNVRNYIGSWGEWADLDPAKYPVEK